MPDAMLCKVRCFDGFINSQVYPEIIKPGGTVWVTLDVAERMMRSQTGIQIEERKLKLNKRTTRRKKTDGPKT